MPLRVSTRELRMSRIFPRWCRLPLRCRRSFQPIVPEVVIIKPFVERDEFVDLLSVRVRRSFQPILRMGGNSSSWGCSGHHWAFPRVATTRMLRVSPEVEWTVRAGSSTEDGVHHWRKCLRRRRGVGEVFNRSSQALVSKLKRGGMLTGPRWWGDHDLRRGYPTNYYLPGASV